MTTIVFDGKTLAGDSQCTIGNTPGRTKKIHAINNCLVGAAGTVSVIKALMAWFTAGAKHEEYPEEAIEDGNSVLMVIELVDGIPQINLYSDSPYPVTIDNQPYAIGSGADFALGAMRMGATAQQALEVACELDVYSSLPGHQLSWTE